MAGATTLSSNYGVTPHGAEDAGHGPMTFDRSFSARTLLNSPRFQMLQRRESYGECSQHWHKLVDFDGNLRTPGPPTSIPMMSSAPAPFFSSLSNRYPRAQYPLAKLINRAFTALLFGEDRCPVPNYPGDDDATDFVGAIVDACDFWTKMVQARNWGGASGTVGMSWCFHNGKPRIEVHRSKHLFVHDWADRQELVPSAVSEVYTYPYEEWDEKAGRFVQNWYWYHRYWDENQDILFRPCPVRIDGKIIEPTWVPEEVVTHNDAEAHFVWIQNIPSDEIDGTPDYDGQYDDFDDIDVVYSVLTRGTTLNLDPTLVLMMDPAKLQTQRGVSKGSDAALKVGESGDAKYLELAGTSVTAGLALFEAKKKAILEVAQCILADPNEVAASGISSVAMKVIYAPMLSAGNVLRGTYGKGGKRILSGMMRVARNRIEDEVLTLPDRIVSEVGPNGEKVDTRVERVPGTSEGLGFKWPQYFQPTAADRTADVTTLSTATGAKQIISTQTANEEAAKVFGRDPAEEWKRLQNEQQADHETAANAFTDADTGGRSTEMTKGLPDGGELKISSTGAAEPKPTPPPGLPGAPGKPPGGAPGLPGGAVAGKAPQAGGGAGAGNGPKIGKLGPPKVPPED